MAKVALPSLIRLISVRREGASRRHLAVESHAGTTTFSAQTSCASTAPSYNPMRRRFGPCFREAYCSSPRSSLIGQPWNCL